MRIGPHPGGPLRLTLAQLREAFGMTQAEVAQAMGTDQSEVSRLERRSDKALVSTLQRYAQALGRAHVEIAVVFPAGHKVLLCSADADDDE